jgi:hypothetical protein
MTRDFRVLIIDDDEVVIRKLGGRISEVRREFEGRSWEIQLRPVRVRVEHCPEKGLRFTRDTFEQLASACSEPIHLIMADYGYLLSGAITSVQERVSAGKNITEDELSTMVLTAADLVAEAKRFAGDLTVDTFKRRNIIDNFLQFDKHLYIYSYTSKEFIRVLGQIDERANSTNRSLPRCKVLAINTRYEFYGNEEFDWPTEPSKHDPRFYAHLAAGLVASYVQRELLEHILGDAKRLKRLRVPRTAGSVAFIMALAAGVATATSWTTQQIFVLSRMGGPEYAVVFGVVAGLIVFTLAVVLPFVFERVILGILAEAKNEGKGT